MHRVVVAAPPAVRAPDDLARLPACADIVELRLDLLEGGRAPDALDGWISRSPCPVLATVRSVGEGGAFAGSPAEAAKLLRAAVEAGAAWIDVEGAVADHLGELPDHVEVVVSFHGHGAADLPLRVGGRAVFQRKIARDVRERRGFDAAIGEGRAAVRERDASVVPYGPLAALRATFTHEDSLLFGSAGVEVVEGQPSLVSLLDDLRAGEVGPDARLYGLLGCPPSASPSPRLHNAAFRALDLHAIYLPLPALGVREALDLPFAGYSVTTPFKEKALALAADADATTHRIGAANTLVRSDSGAWRALNTDALALHELTPAARAGETAFVYGSGGFARAAVFALVGKGYSVRLAGCDDVQGRALADATPCTWTEGDRYERVSGDRVLINATPAGVGGETPAFLGGANLDGLVVLDAPYAAEGVETGLVRAARGRAAVVIDGLTFLERQAAHQVQVFSGRSAPPRVLETALQPPLPLLLMGLRGAGKTTVGRIVATRLGRPFLDLDEEVERITGRAPERWLRDDGQEAFREAELDALQRLQGRRGVVVAAGGGVLEHPRARRIVEAHTVPVWLDVPVEVAARRVAADARDRPPLVSTSEPLEEARRILARRRRAWRQVALHIVDGSSSAEDVGERVASCWSGP